MNLLATPNLDSSIAVRDNKTPAPLCHVVNLFTVDPDVVRAPLFAAVTQFTHVDG